MHEHDHHDRAVYRRRRITLALILVGLVALAAVLISRLGGSDDSASPGTTGPSAVTTAPPEPTAPPTDAAGTDASATSDTLAPATSVAATSPATGSTAAEGSSPTVPATSDDPADDPTSAERSATAPSGPVPATTPDASDPAAVETTAGSVPDTPPNEVTVRWDGEGAVLTGVVASSAATEVARDVVDELAAGAPIEDRTVVDRSVDEADLTVVIEDLRGVGFDRDVYDQVAPELAETLDRLAVVLEQYPDATAVLIGHAVTDGDDPADRAAAIERADAARAHLLDAGVDGDRVTTFGAGEDGTVPATGETSVNRRIDYVIDDLPIG